MADTASLNKRADIYPPMVGWLRCDDQLTTTITLNGALLCSLVELFPLMARVRIFANGKQLVEAFSAEITAVGFVIMDLNEILGDVMVRQGYYELTIFPKFSDDKSHAFFAEAWSSIYSKDGRTAVNYPPLMTRGVDISMVDSSYLYYPGVTSTAAFSYRFLGINHHDVPNEYDIVVYNASGEKRLYQTFSIAPRTVHSPFLEEIFPKQDLRAFFQDGPGLFLFHFKYKMNAFMQTVYQPDHIVTGMDHLGILFSNDLPSEDRIVDSETAYRNRESDPLVCYCRSVPTSRVCHLKDIGMNLASIIETTQAGLICRGCIQDLEKMSGEIFCEPVRSSQAKAVSDDL